MPQVGTGYSDSVQQFNVHTECLGTSSQPKECIFLREILVGIDI